MQLAGLGGAISCNLEGSFLSNIPLYATFELMVALCLDSVVGKSGLTPSQQKTEWSGKAPAFTSNAKT